MLLELTTNQKGAIAEAAITKAAVELGIDVYRPAVEGGRYDLILGIKERLVRVQVKWAARNGEVIYVRCQRCRRGPNGLIRRSYEAAEIDAIAAYCADLDQCYLLPHDMSVGRNSVQLRLTAARNNQKHGINWAPNFEFGAKLDTLGP